MKANELRCDGVRIVFPTNQENPDKAVAELERFMATFNIEVELGGAMRLFDGADKLMEEV